MKPRLVTRKTRIVAAAAADVDKVTRAICMSNLFSINCETNF